MNWQAKSSEEVVEGVEEDEEEGVEVEGGKVGGKVE